MTDWAKGDLALCMDNSGAFGTSAGDVNLKRGGIYQVEAVIDACLWINGVTAIGLVLAGVRSRAPHGDYYCHRFRKIRPSAIKHIEVLKDIPVPVRETENA